MNNINQDSKFRLAINYLKWLVPHASIEISKMTDNKTLCEKQLNDIRDFIKRSEPKKKLLPEVYLPKGNLK
jgi:hypothetical protein